MHRRIAWIGSLLCCMSGAVAIAAESPDTSSPGWTSVRSMHADYVRAFVESEGFGMRRITPMMLLMQSGVLVLDGTPMRVGDVQLIGIAKHDPPVVYAAVFQGFQHGQEGMQIGQHPTRDIDNDEARMLLAFARGQEAAASDGTGGPRAIGPIRARSECLSCHRDNRIGDLLGALSYRLEPIPAPER